MDLELDRVSQIAQSAQKANDAMRQHWNGVVCKEFNVPTYYQSVSVLLIHWADWLDTDLKCADETTELESVFRDKYHYTTTRVVLDCKKKKPQAQLHRATSQFISDYDGSHRTTLLIVYYSGHGYLEEENGVERLYISGTQNTQAGDKTTDTQHEPTCRWKSVETHLQDADADVLTIMDSCYAAAVINKNNRRVERSFETLAAAHEYTRQPGPESFTRALIDSLTDLHVEPADSIRPPFDTSRLHDRIMRRMRTMRRKHHIPPLLNRNENRNARHICLAPLSKNELQPIRQTDRAKGILHLQVVFEKNRELDMDETTRLASSLAQAAKSTNLNITTLDWVVFEPSAPKIRITVSVHKFLRIWVRNWRDRRRVRDRNRDRARSQHGNQRDSNRPLKRLRVASPARPHSPLTPPGNS